jgi:hypothetical protein
MPWKFAEIKSFRNTKHEHVCKAALQTAVSKIA